MTYRERLWAPWWLWLCVAFWPAMLGLAYAAATSGGVGLAVGGGLAVVALVALWRYSLAIRVDEAGVQVGRVSLEARYLGSAVALDRKQAKALRGVEADPRAFTALRGWVSTGVQLRLDDVRDPTPYWLISTRRPEALVAALERARTG